MALTESHVREFLDLIGEDVERQGLQDTPKRVMKAWYEWTNGYGRDPREVLKSFSDGAENYDQLVVVRDIPFYSHCEHHLAPFFGRVHIGYIPGDRIVGLSKFPRLVDIYAHRLQVQERLTQQIATAIEECLKPSGVGVVIEARHLCMESRGICRAGSITVTSALKGALKDEPDARSEFLGLTRSSPNVQV